MKKIFFIVAAIIFSNIITAQTPEAFFKVNMHYSGGTNTDVLNIVEIKGLPESQMQSTSKQLATGLPMNINLYAISDKTSTGMQSTYVTDSIDIIPIGVMTNCGAGEAYTYWMSISDVAIAAQHDSLILLDTYTGEFIDIEEGQILNFTADSCKTINDRFVIAHKKGFTPDEGDVSVCAYYNYVEILNNPFTTNIVIKDMQGNVVLTRVPLATPQRIPLEDFESGHYILEIGTESFEFCNKPVKDN